MTLTALRGYQLVAVDLDGTLLDSTKRIPRANERAIEDLTRAGVHVAVVSGRRFSALARFLRPLPREVLVVANSGAIVKRGVEGPILRRELLPLRSAREVVRFADAAGVEPIVHDGPEAEGHLVLRTSARALPWMARYLRETSPEPNWVDTLTLERDPVQIGFTGSVAAIRSFEASLRRELVEHEIASARTEYPDEDLALLDVLSVKATKSKALEFLAEHLGIAVSETMAIGDNWNDLDMLERAGLGVIMGNAPPELIGRGFATTTSNDDDGVAAAVRRHVLDPARRK